ncbi:phage holin family protein [Streptomyces colonosanans]|uniref:Phage holin family protein n=1 Tax=Streptomyces colonosanans TaxID=1428652 RepID=A0A1S2P4E4_9ACTN|nr:phage holin family protein [Streptomyces colonosanans]OIJ88305.1 hypothetical protein BIV24_22315 [Streptomyces colonosanans]
MNRMDHLEHLDKGVVDELAQVAREVVRDELREQSRKQRRAAMLYASSGAAGLYTGAALALAVGLALALSLPGWAAALVTAVLLGGAAYLLRRQARSAGGHGGMPRSAEGPVLGGTQPTRAAGRPGVPGTGPSASGIPGRPAPGSSRPGADPEDPRHRAR